MKMNRTIYIYWDGPCHSLIEILKDLIYLHADSGKGYKVKLLNQENVKDYVDDLPKYFSSLKPAHRADFARVCTLRKNGGIWLDLDTLVLGSLDCLFDTIEEKEGFFLLENNKNICNGFFGTKKETRIMKVWENIMREKVDKHKTNIEWTEIGSNILYKLSIEQPDLYTNYKFFNGLDTVQPVPLGRSVKAYLKKPYDFYRNITRDYQPLLVLNQNIYKNLRGMTKQDILNAEMPINYFINKSLNGK